jgi:hypothetical protein
MLLNFGRDRIKILALLKQNCCAIVLPKISEMRLDIVFQIHWNVFACTKRLVLYLLDEGEPSL